MDDKLREALRIAHGILADAPEINPSNYDHDEVCALNAASIEAYAVLHDALTTPAAPGDETVERVHELKTWPFYFQAVLDGLKPFEVRRNDRDYAVGDVLWLREWCQARAEYTGRECRRTVTFLLEGGSFGVAEGYVVMGLTTPPSTAAAEWNAAVEALRETREALVEACHEIADLRARANNHGGMFDSYEFPEGVAAIAKIDALTRDAATPTAGERA